MFFRSIQWRLIFILSLITFVLLTVVWVFLNFQVEQSYYETFRDEIADRYADLGIEEGITVDALRETLRSDLYMASLILGDYRSLTLIDRESGAILYSSDPAWQDASLQTQFRTAIFQSINLLAVMDGDPEGMHPSATRTRLQGFDDFYSYVRVQSTANGETLLFFKYSRERARAVLSNFNSLILTSLLVALIAALGIGLAMSRTITRPITDIMHKAERITEGEFGQLLEVKSGDEIGKLTSTFNFMSTRLKNMLTEIAAEKEKMETVINHMSDGIMAFDRTGMVIQTNHAASVLLSGLQGPRRRKASEKPLRFNDLMHELGSTVTLEAVLAEDANGRKPVTIAIGDRFVRFAFAAFADEAGPRGGVITVLQDITEEQRLENMRREFVANVSHELRTPLTSVKSYTETLLDGAVEDQEVTLRFLHVINDETDRMVRLVKDLLLLSQHDNGLQLTLAPIDPEEITRVCIERLRRAAEEKQQTLTQERLPGLPDPLRIRGDRDRLEQLLLNIVGNAIKYTPARGAVTVSLAPENEGLSIRVRDTGIGIPEKDIDRIFERFYRVDKARSRQMGGTGLGLAIAKEIALLHGGTIHAQSKVGEGSVISVRFPLLMSMEDIPPTDREQEDGSDADGLA